MRIDPWTAFTVIVSLASAAASYQGGHDEGLERAIVALQKAFEDLENSRVCPDPANQNDPPELGE